MVRTTTAGRHLAAALAGTLFMVSMALPPLRADAHPSAARTMTMDLIMGEGGLVLIDVAANRGDDANGFPPEQRLSPEQRSDLANELLAAFGIPTATAQVDAQASVLYHDVGFTIALHAPFANGASPGELAFSTSPLQALAASAAGDLRLDVCRDTLSTAALRVDSSPPASPPDPAGAGAPETGRSDCASWTVGPDDPPAIIAARATGGGAPDVRRRVALSCGTPSDGGAGTRVGPVIPPRRTLLAHATGSSDDTTLVADAVLSFSSDDGVTVSVPRTWRGHLTIGTREGPRASRQLVIPACRPPWMSYVLRIAVDRAACVPLTLSTPKSRHAIRLAVGSPCRHGADPRGRS